jgi:hypothetical protein
MHRTCGLTPPQLRGLENEPLPRHGITHVRRGSPTPPERPTEGLHFGVRPSRGTPEDLRSCHGRGQETRAQPKSLVATSRDHPCSARVSDPAGTPDRRSPFRRSSQPTGTSEDLRSHHGRSQETTAFNISVFRVPAQRVAMCGTRTRGFDYVPAVNARGVFGRKDTHRNFLALLRRAGEPGPRG